MKVLLTTLNSKYIHSSPALKYLYSAAENSGAFIDVREFTINNEEDYIYGELLSKHWDVVCFSCYIWNIEKTLYIAENMKKARPDVKVLLGGPEVSFDSALLMQKHPFIDYVIRGEGEEPFPMIMKLFSEFGSADSEFCTNIARDIFEYGLEDIPNLVYRCRGHIYENREKAPQAFEKSEFPYKYFPIPEDKIVYYESSRGCPFRCAYCLSSIEKSMRPLPLDRVFSELSYFIHSRIKQVKFIDRTFNYDSKRACAILKYLIDNDNGVTNFHFEICSDLLDDETLSLIAKARKGLFQFEIGVQSTNTKTLEAINRGGTLEKTINMARRLTEIGNSEVHVDLIAGLPYEGYDSFKKSFNDVYVIGADMFALGFLKLLKGTAMRDEAEKYGYIYREKAPYEVIANEFITAEELVRLKKIETVLDLYFNRKGFARTVEYFIAVHFDTPFDFYESLADFYYAKGYQHASHRKEDLYRILGAFAKTFEGDGFDGCEESGGGTIENRVRELLMEDMKDTLNFDAVKKFVKSGWELKA